MNETDGQSTANEAQASGNVVELPQKPADEVAGGPARFVREHPLLTIAGGIALGAVAASLLPRGTSRKLARRAVGLAEMAGSAGALLGTRVRERAGSARAELREQGDAMADRLERLGESASERLGELSEVAGSRMEKLLDPIENAAGKVARKAAELRSRTRR